MATEHIKIDDVTPRIAYTATAGQTVFNITFAFFSNSDLKVYVNDVLRADYTAAGAGASEPSTRKITFNAGLALNDKVVILRDIPVDRTTDFPSSGPLLIDTLNTQLDKLTAILQQLEDSIARTLRLADSDITTNLSIPAAAARANKFLGFNSAGDPIMSTSVTGTPVSVFMATVLDDPDATTARATLGVADTSSYAGLSNWHTSR